MDEDFDHSVLGLTCLENICHWAHRLRQQQLLDAWQASGTVLKIVDAASQQPDTIYLSPHPNGLPECHYEWPTGDEELDAITVEIVALEIWEILRKGGYKECHYEGKDPFVLACLGYLRRLGIVP